MEKREEVLSILRVSAMERVDDDTARRGSADDSAGGSLLGEESRLSPVMVPGSAVGVYS